jgi:hypothetical protein
MKKLLIIFLLCTGIVSSAVRAIDTYTLTGDIFIDNAEDATELGIMMSVLTPFTINLTFDPENALFSGAIIGSSGVSHGYRGESGNFEIINGFNISESESRVSVQVRDGTISDGVSFNYSGNLSGGIYERIGISLFVDTMRTDVITGLPPFPDDNASARFVREIATGFAPTRASVGLLDFDTSSTRSYQVFNLGLSVTSAIPEPATWLMMIFGFGITGLALRRRSHRRIYT